MRSEEALAEQGFGVTRRSRRLEKESVSADVEVPRDSGGAGAVGFGSGIPRVDHQPVAAGLSANEAAGLAVGLLE